MTNPEPEVLIETLDGIALLTLNRPENRNAIGWTMSRSLLDALDTVEKDEGIRAVVLTGAGKTFCAGAKVGESIGQDVRDNALRDAGFRDSVEAVRRLRTFELPVICALTGTAVGGGVAFALACDLVVAAEDSGYLFAFGRVGASAADLGCGYLLPRIVGSLRARHILLTGMRVDARTGKDYGLFAEIAAPETLLDTAINLARSVSHAGTRQSIAATKQVLMRGETTDFDTCLYYELYLQTYLLNSEESRRKVTEMVAGLKKV